MISFNYETDFDLPNENEMSTWISNVIVSENCREGEINYIFCSDDYLHDINVKYLDHDTLTDIISFDYSVGKELHGDVYISIDRVKDNAVDFNVDFVEEIKRVMVHGVLHYCGYKDKSIEDKSVMRTKEDFYIKQLS
ncbi:rRNA maturation RNase YbeY [Psychroserpens ponticola]|uniref:Endoribonuclease YbeY n=1 Tax=Psychroserpens ponticola TaxID=2932268 RepID=A0ABY7RXC2_9FLAO|nr:rRNA maturation RNase YbeY [Psychroserpens ponticola]WCO01668.1 rRNA maturation RNase YbeY [Psychroserpens ponticola]